MSANPEFDLKAFQSEVLKDFTAFQITFATANMKFEDLEGKIHLPDLKTGIFVRILLAGFRKFAQRVERGVQEKDDFTAKEVKASEIADNPKIKQLLCPFLKAEILPSLVTEAVRARMVRIVTSSLTDTKIAHEFSIEKDVRLFTLIILKIWQKGIGAYCE